MVLVWVRQFGYLENFSTKCYAQVILNQPWNILHCVIVHTILQEIRKHWTGALIKKFGNIGQTLWLKNVKNIWTIKKEKMKKLQWDFRIFLRISLEIQN